MSSYKRGEVVLVLFPFADGHRAVERPAVVLHNAAPEDAGVSLVPLVPPTLDSPNALHVEHGSFEAARMGLLSTLALNVHATLDVPKELVTQVIGRCPYGLLDRALQLRRSPLASMEREALANPEEPETAAPTAVADYHSRFPVERARYTCHRTPVPIEIDGYLDKPVWRAAPTSEAFVDIVSGEPAWFDTRVKMLWDDDYLYFGFKAEERDVWGTLTERDSKIYEENDLEIFIAGQNAYYEFEISACNVIYEVFWIWKDIHGPNGPYADRPEFQPESQRTMVLDGVGGHVHPRGERWGFLDWDMPGLKHAVHVDGTLNQRDDVDRGWTAEVAIPWKSLSLLADGRSLPPKNGDVWRIDCSRFQCIGRNGESLNPGAGWTWNQHGHYDSHIPEVFPYVTFSTEAIVPEMPHRDQG